MGPACFVHSFCLLFLPISLVLEVEMMGVPSGTGQVNECRLEERDGRENGEGRAVADRVSMVRV